MPILKEEPSLFPDTLWEDCLSTISESQWWVIYTKARQEKALSRELLSWKVPFYLPLIKHITMSRGRRRTSFVPLFSGYIFLFASELQRVQSLRSNRVSRILTVNDPQQLVFDLSQLRRLIEIDAPLSVERRLEPGNRVRVKQGSLMGLEGTVLMRRGITRLLVRINFLQQGASVEIEDFLLERLD
ncbi:MAG: transcription termination/antitermination NusG family protein [Thermoguttaceae bacterium]